MHQQKCSPTPTPSPRNYTFTSTLTSTPINYTFTPTSTLTPTPRTYTFTPTPTPTPRTYTLTPKLTLTPRTSPLIFIPTPTPYSITAPAHYSTSTLIAPTRELKSVLTIFVHLGFEAFPKPACPALVAMGLVYGAVSSSFSLLLADVNSASVDTSLEETTAPITGVNTVVLPRATVTAYFTRNVEKAITCRKKRRLKREKNVND